jgi:hypothetical protein
MLMKKGKDEILAKAEVAVATDLDRNSNRNPNRSRPPRTSETRPKGKGKGRSQKGKSTSTTHTSRDRKPKEPCSYCGGTNHSARTCYKRQNDEKNEKSKTPHQQANLNLQIDETTLMFQNSVLTVFHSESDPHTDTTRWGENEQVEETATYRDHDEHTDDESTTEHNNETQEKGEYYKEETIYEKTNEATEALEQIVKTMNQLPNNHYVWGYPDPTRVYYTYEQGDKWEGTTNDEYQHKKDFIQWYDSQLHNMTEMKAMQMLMGYYDELTEGTEANDQEAPANFQVETKHKIEKEGIKQEHVNEELTTEYAKTD